MGRNVENRKRLIAITEGNLRNRHLYITGHHDFFPDECYGSSSARRGTGHKLTLLVEGLPNAVQTDIATGGEHGHPRNFFRKRGWVGDFFEKQRLQVGNFIAIARLDSFTYRVCPFRNAEAKKGTAKPSLQERQIGLLPGVIESAVQNGRSRFGDTAFTRNRQEPLHRWAESLFRERGNLA